MSESENNYTPSKEWNKILDDMVPVNRNGRPDAMSIYGSGTVGGRVQPIEYYLADPDDLEVDEPLTWRRETDIRPTPAVAGDPYKGYAEMYSKGPRVSAATYKAAPADQGRATAGAPAGKAPSGGGRPASGKTAAGGRPASGKGRGASSGKGKTPAGKGKTTASAPVKPVGANPRPVKPTTGGATSPITPVKPAAPKTSGRGNGTGGAAHTGRTGEGFPGSFKDYIQGNAQSSYGGVEYDPFAGAGSQTHPTDGSAARKPEPPQYTHQPTIVPVGKDSKEPAKPKGPSNVALAADAFFTAMSDRRQERKRAREEDRNYWGTRVTKGTVSGKDPIYDDIKANGHRLDLIHYQLFKVDKTTQRGVYPGIVKAERTEQIRAIHRNKWMFVAKSVSVMLIVVVIAGFYIFNTMQKYDVNIDLANARKAYKQNVAILADYEAKLDAKVTDEQVADYAENYLHWVKVTRDHVRNIDFSIPGELHGDNAVRVLVPDAAALAAPAADEAEAPAAETPEPEEEAPAGAEKTKLMDRMLDLVFGN